MCRIRKRWKYGWSKGFTANCLVLKRGSESIDGVVGEEGEDEEANVDDGDDGDDGDDRDDGR
jgi:hypothetical protein